ncbi:MAG TPA: DUF192 domain-containing protein [Fibrobacteria bacterium]|nr:DUF192 domain-containing protein [Fibrobacteria bacterium]HOX52866.1 DUF192 domain-containing protein [Fibrobacteria bacterium]
MILPLILSVFVGKSIARPASVSTPVAVRTQEATLEMGQTRLALEIVDNDSLRTLGLSNRTRLDWNRGMLFVFPDEAPRSFWMIDCHFDLDIAYIDSTGTIVDIQAMMVEPGVSPERLRQYPSASPRVKYALEVNRGWFSAHGVKVGMHYPAIARFTTRR